VYVLEDCPILFGILNASFVAEGFGIAFEIDNISAILLLSKHFGDCCLTPLIRVWLCFLSTPAHTFALPIGLRYKNLIVLENPCNGLVSIPLNTETEYPSHNLCRIGIDDPLLFVFGVFHVAIRRWS